MLIKNQAIWAIKIGQKREGWKKQRVVQVALDSIKIGFEHFVDKSEEKEK